MRPVRLMRSTSPAAHTEAAAGVPASTIGHLTDSFAGRIEARAGD